MRLSRAAGALALSLVASGGLVFTAAPAESLTRDRLTVSQSNPVAEADYPSIPGQFAQSTNVITPLPGGCGNDEGVSDTDDPPPFGAMCDRIPLRIVVPTDLAQTDDYIVGITLSWNDSVGEAAGANGTGNDLDLYIYDNGQIDRRDDPESTSFTQQTSSASTSNPESAKMGSPNLVDYNIIVVNASGANEGYHVKVEFRVAKGDKLLELLDESARPPQKPIAEESSENLVIPDLSDFPQGGSGEELIAVIPGFDLDFGSPELAPLEAALRAPIQEDRIAIRREKPGPVSGMTLAFWLGVVPGGFVAALLLGLRRRNAFSLS